MNFSPEKLFLVGIIALVVLGPNRLPQAARTLGRLLADFRRVSSSLQSEVTQALAEPRDAMQQSIGEFGLTNVRSQLRNTINEVVTGPRPANGVSAGPGDGGVVTGVGLNGSAGPTDGTLDAGSPTGGGVGAPIVDPSQTIEVNAPTHPAPSSPSRALPVPDDPSFN